MCEVCGIKTACPIYKTRASLLEQGASFEINTCKRYVPLISFRKPYLGLKEAYFNTMRSGVTRVNRVSENSIVCLVGAENGEIIRFARVAKVFSGPVDKMLKINARVQPSMSRRKNSGRGKNRYPKVIRPLPERRQLADGNLPEKSKARARLGISHRRRNSNDGGRHPAR